MQNALTTSLQSASYVADYGDDSSKLIQLYKTFVVKPLARLYLWGPRWGNWGFWGGQTLHDICAQITSVSSDFWIKHPDECLVVISKSFYSLLILFESILYVVFIYKAVQFVWWVGGCLSSFFKYHCMRRTVRRTGGKSPNGGNDCSQ